MIEEAILKLQQVSGAKTSTKMSQFYKSQRLYNGFADVESNYVYVKCHSTNICLKRPFRSLTKGARAFFCKFMRKEQTKFCFSFLWGIVPYDVKFVVTFYNM